MHRKVELDGKGGMGKMGGLKQSSWDEKKVGRKAFSSKKSKIGTYCCLL